jgi:hypothetical protein
MPLRSRIDAGSAPTRPRDRALETWAGVIVGILVGLFYLWSALQPVNSWKISSRNPQGYYGIETAGFRAGHLYAAITPHPALMALADPYDPVANAPYRVHDMSLYKGHYYLYFGVTPVLILFWPVAAITGEYLSEPFAVALFCSGAVWVGMGLLLAIRRRHFPLAPVWVLVAGWLCVAWATPLSLLVEAPQFYQVPISCAIFLQALMIAAVYRALHSPSRALAWMGVSGLLFGLCVGSRPNYLGTFVVLLIPIIFRARSTPADPKGRSPSMFRALLATFLPVALCGLGLLYFNWARFGSVSEFGMHFQLGGERFTALNAISLRYLIPHAFFYLFNSGHWGWYFPFFSPQTGQPYGLFHYLPWAWLSVAAFLFPKKGSLGERRGRTAIVLALACAFLANLAFLSCFFGTTARYPGDFANAALILGGVGALALGQRAARLERPRIVGAALAGAAGISLLFGLVVYGGLLPGKDRFLGLARAANLPGFLWQEAHGDQFGGIRLELRLPERPPSLAEPLVETGRQSDQRDWLQIDYLPKNRARISFFHAGTGAFPGRDFGIPNDRKIVIEARFGSLQPPFGHPVFSSWSREEYDNANRDLRISVNGEDVLRASIECYDSSPADLTIGHFAWATGGIQQVFSGSILGVERLPLAKPMTIAPRFTKPGPVELTLFFPAGKRTGVEPVLVTGKGTESDLLYCIYDGVNQIKFALDHFGSGGPISESIHYDPVGSHVLTIWMGSMAGSSSGTAASDRLAVVLDRRPVLDVDQVFYPSSPESVVLGSNPYGSTSAGGSFSGRIEGVRQASDSELPALVRDGTYGAVEMSVNFPLGVLGTQEPLVVTGISGAGDFVYVRYVDANHVVIGFDHWGIGGIQGKPIEVDYGQMHRLAITFQALYPPDSPRHQSDAVRVLLDGKPALVGNYGCHPSARERIRIGTNQIGGSTCGPAFTGRISGVKRFAEPRE